MEKEKELIEKVIQEIKRTEKEEFRIQKEKKADWARRKQEEEYRFWVTLAILCLITPFLFIAISYLFQMLFVE